MAFVCFQTTIQLGLRDLSFGSILQSPFPSLVLKCIKRCLIKLQGFLITRVLSLRAKQHSPHNKGQLPNIYSRTPLLFEHLLAYPSLIINTRMEDLRRHNYFGRMHWIFLAVQYFHLEYSFFVGGVLRAVENHVEMVKVQRVAVDVEIVAVLFIGFKGLVILCQTVSQFLHYSAESINDYMMDLERILAVNKQLI